MDIENYDRLIEKKHEALGRGVSSVVKSALSQRKWKIQTLSDRTGVARPTLSALLSMAGGRSWSLNHLLRTATALNVTLTDLISAAELGTQLPFALDLAGTEPRSKERLTRIIQSLATKGTSKEVLDLYFTTEMFQVSVPQYAADYYAGAVDDREVYELLCRVNENLEPGDNLWMKLSAFAADSKATVITKTGDEN